MKIAFVLKYFLPAKTAGTEVYAAALCRELMRLNAEVLIIKPGIGLQVMNEYYYENIRVIEYPESSLIDKELQTANRKPEGLQHFKKCLMDEKPDVIHFHEITGSNGITPDHLKMAKELGIPVFMTLHLIGYVCQTGMLSYKDNYPCNGVVETYKCSVCTLYKKGFRYQSAEVLSSVGQWINKSKIDPSFMPTIIQSALSYPLYTNKHFAQLKEIFSISEKVFVLSSWFKEILLANNFSPAKMVLLQKALPYENLSGKKQYVLKNKGEVIKFVYIGRISKIKGLHIVLQALKSIQHLNWCLDIYGQVEEENYKLRCNQIIKDSLNKVQWKGTIEPTEVVKTLQQYDALLFPTIIQEMVGLVVQEAFAAGIPIIGADVKGIAEQVTAKVNGLLFKRGDANELQQILVEVIADPSILFNLATNIQPPRSFKQVAQQTLATYQIILGNKTRLQVS